jgi:hypothetical protein
MRHVPKGALEGGGRGSVGPRALGRRPLVCGTVIVGLPWMALGFVGSGRCIAKRVPLRLSTLASVIVGFSIQVPILVAATTPAIVQTRSPSPSYANVAVFPPHVTLVSLLSTVYTSVYVTPSTIRRTIDPLASYE